MPLMISAGDSFLHSFIHSALSLCCRVLVCWLGWFSFNHVLLISCTVDSSRFGKLQCACEITAGLTLYVFMVNIKWYMSDRLPVCMNTVTVPVIVSAVFHQY